MPSSSPQLDQTFENVWPRQDACRCLGYKACGVIFIPSNLDQPSLTEKKQNGKTEIKQECLPHIFYHFNNFNNPSIHTETNSRSNPGTGEQSNSWQNLKSFNLIQTAPSPGYHGSQALGEHLCQTWSALLAESHHPVVFPGANERIIDEPNHSSYNKCQHVNTRKILE